MPSVFPSSRTFETATHRLDGVLSDEERREVVEFALRSLDATHASREPDVDALRGCPEVHGYDLERPFVLEDFVRSLSSTGFQASALGEAIAIVREMRDRQVPLYLGITSNIGTCGLRDNLTYLVSHGHIRGLAATAGAIEEDVMKVLLPFVIGEYRADDRSLHRKSVCRTGNILIPGGRYTWLHLLLWTLHRRLKRAGLTQIGVVEYVREMGRQLELLDISGREGSFVYQAWRMGIDIYCPAILDGAIGDAVYYARRRDAEFVMDVCRCHQQLIEHMMVARSQAGALGIVALGGSVAKHMLCNAAIFSGGAGYAVYINTATEADGSNAGATTSEAISWGKIREDARAVKVEAEATLVFPLLLAAAFQEYQPKRPIENAQAASSEEHERSTS